MYVSSTAPIMPDLASEVAANAACDTACASNALMASLTGRNAALTTLMSPSDLGELFGIGLGNNAAITQQQTRAARSTALLGGYSPFVLPSVPETIAQSPTVVPLNSGASCGVTRTRSAADLQPVTPGMPQRAPNIVNGPDGPMYYRGQISTVVGTQPSNGLTGYSPTWSDASVTEDTNFGVGNQGRACGWWLLVAALGIGVYAASQRSK
jgi:hypothetical protein